MCFLGCNLGFDSHPVSNPPSAPIRGYSRITNRGLQASPASDSYPESVI